MERRAATAREEPIVRRGSRARPALSYAQELCGS